MRKNIWSIGILWFMTVVLLSGCGKLKGQGNNLYKENHLKQKTEEEALTDDIYDSSQVSVSDQEQSTTVIPIISEGSSENQVESIANIDLVTETSTEEPTESLTKEQRESQTETPAEEPTEVLTKEQRESQTETLTEDKMLQVTELSVVMYAKRAVNVRQGPSTEYAKMGTLSEREQVSVTGRVENGWYRISYDSGEGYVSGNYLVETLSSVETQASTQAPTEAPTEAPTQAPTEVQTSATTQEITTSNTNNSKQKKEAEARVVAQEIADYIKETLPSGTDLERIEMAAMIVSRYCSYCVYTTQGENYSQAYGVFISGEFSCAGATRATGMVLECLGYSWEHVNENQWTHQWCIVNMDGQIGWADGQIGFAGYGDHPVTTDGVIHDKDGGFIIFG